jgi:hypothetical protein
MMIVFSRARGLHAEAAHTSEITSLLLVAFSPPLPPPSLPPSPILPSFLRVVSGTKTYLVSVGLIGLLREARYPEDLRGLEKTTERALMHVHLAVINKLH